MSIEIIKAFSGQKPIVIYPVYLDITGDYATAAALGQVLYWHEVMRGKFYKTDSDFEQELHLTPNQFRRVKTELKSLPFLKITVEQIPAKTFYDVDYEALASLIGQIRTHQKGETVPAQKGETVPAQKGETVPAQKGETITENTTENTTENNNNNETIDLNNHAIHAHELLLSLNFEEIAPTLSKAFSSEQKERQKEEVVLLPLTGLNERQAKEASKKLAQLSPDQREIAIMTFNQTAELGRIRKPMALVNQLVNLGLNNELEPPLNAFNQNPTPTPTQELKTHSEANNEASNEDSRRETILEVLKLKVAKYKDKMLAEFQRNRAVFIQGLGVFYK